MESGRIDEQDGYHRAVMVDEVVGLMSAITSGVVIDATFGGGGHSRVLRRELGSNVDIVGIDRDPDARDTATGDIAVLAGDFVNLGELLDAASIGSIAGILFDFGVSSHQLDVAARGFSYHADGPLDMRMDPTTGRTASQLIDQVDADELARIIRRFGDEPLAKRLADAIIAARPISTTTQLAEVVASATPAARRSGAHPARKTFQALRIAVNDELTAVASGLEQAIVRLESGGRCVAISYHSLEDRIVKRRFAEGARGCVCPPGLPVCGCGAEPELRLLIKGAQRPSDREIEHNRRARSARLRAAEKAEAA